MDIRLNSTFTLFQPGRETLSPSYFLLHFVDVDQQQQRFAIVQNQGAANGPLLFEVTEMEAGNPTLGQVQLYAANWQLTVYEQSSATNQDIASAGRKVWTELVGVCEQPDIPAREPYDPCIGCGDDPCLPTTVNGAESTTPTIVVSQGGNPVGTLNPATGVVTIEECPEGCTEPTPFSIGGYVVAQSGECGVPVNVDCDEKVPNTLILQGCGCPLANSLYVQDEEGQTWTNATETRWIFPLDPDAGTSVWQVGTKETGGTIFYKTTTPSSSPTNAGLVWEVVDGPGPAPSEVRDALVSDLCPCPDPEPCPLGYTLQDSAGNALIAGIINDPCVEPTLLLTAPDGSAQLKDSDGNNIGSPVAVRSGQNNVPVVTPDITVNISVNGTPEAPIPDVNPYVTNTFNITIN